jgi:hypothetical protein
MISFFRKLRRPSTQSESSYSHTSPVGRYVLYAIGEILLVMVGILLALQVNNWNEDRKDLREEQVLLKILRDDFTSRLAELELLNAGRTRAVQSIETLMSYVENTSSLPSEEALDSLLAITTLTYRFNEQFSTLEMLFNSGGINQLSNDSLKVLLTNWPNLVEEMLEEQRLVVNHFPKLESVLEKYVSLRDIYQKYEWSFHNIPDIPPSNLTKDYFRMLADPGFENVIASKRFLLYINIADTEKIIQDARKIIEILDDEIEN